jgi:hypothetical protein
MNLHESVALFFKDIPAKRVASTLGLSLSHTYRLAEAEGKDYLTAQMAVVLTKTFQNNSIINTICELCDGAFLPIKTAQGQTLNNQSIKTIQAEINALKAITDALSDGKISTKEAEKIHAAFRAAIKALAEFLILLQAADLAADTAETEGDDE